MRKLYEIFMILQIQKRIVSAETIRGNTVCLFKRIQKFAMCKRLHISTGSIHSRLIQSIIFASTCPILFLKLMAFQSQIERQSQNTERSYMKKI